MEWKPIQSAPDMERVLVAGWQKPSGRVAGYWWWEEGVCDNGEHISGCGSRATLWAPIILPPFPPEPV